MSSVLTVLICSSALAAVTSTSAAAGSALRARSAVTMTYSGCRLEPRGWACAVTAASTAKTDVDAQRRGILDMGFPWKCESGQAGFSPRGGQIRLRRSGAGREVLAA